MYKTLTCRLLLVASLFLLSTSTQVLATDKTEEITSSMVISDKISINQATNHELARINGIGPQKAQAIIEYREANGDFLGIEDLINVKGIGKSTLQKISPFVSL